MSRWLRVSTAREVAVGPFLDSTDGITPETALTVTSAEVLLKKNEADWAAKTEATSLVHESGGWYRCLLDTTDTNALGVLMLYVNEGGAVPVWHQFMVVPANVWDSLFGADLLDVSVTQWLGTAAATPTVAGVPEVDITNIAGAAVSTTTAQLGVNVVQISTDATAADNAEAFFDGTGYAGTNNVIPTVTNVTNQVTAAATADAVWDEDATAHQTAGTFGKALGDPLARTNSLMQSIPDAVAGAAGGLFIAGTNAATTITTALTTTFTGNLTGSVASVTGAVGSVAGLTVATIADGVWDEAISGHLGAGSTGLALNSAGAAGDPWSTAIPGAYGAGTAGRRLGRIPDVAAGAAGGLFIAGTNAATAITTGLTTTFTGNLTGSVGSVTGAVGSVTGLTNATIGDAVWDEAIAGHLGAGSTGAALNAAGGAGDPWTIAIPGAYGAGTAGKIVGDNLNATISSRASQTSVDDVPTATEIWDHVVEGATTARGMMRVFLSSLAGKLSGASGIAPFTLRFRDRADTKDRIVATTDVDGNRSSVTIDPS